MEPSSQTIRVSWRIAALPPSIAPWGPLGSPPSRSTPSHRDSRAAFGGVLSPAPAVLGVRVCSKTSLVVKKPDSRRACGSRLLKAVYPLKPALPPQPPPAHHPRHASPCDKCPHQDPPVPLHG